MILTSTDHSRASAGLIYVYPVMSRRSGGLSVGINLNPNNACNWRCVYCQVPDLVAGGPPPIDVRQLRDELESFLDDVIHGDFYDRHDIAGDLRTIKDIAVSGNGEPTGAENFDQIIDLLGHSMRRFDLQDKIAPVLITNGSLMHKKTVQAGLSRLAKLNGVVWFKLDGGSDERLKHVNHARLSIHRVKENMKIAGGLCPLYLQSCFFQWDGSPPGEHDRSDYLDLLACLRRQELDIKGVLLYGLARPSMQPEAFRLSPVSADWLNRLASDVRGLGFDVQCFE